MRFKHFFKPTLLEMNVANLDQIKKDIADIFDVESGARHRPVPQATRDLFLKRCLKVMTNDEAGHIVHANPLEKLPANAPAWMVKAAEQGQPIMVLGLKTVFVDKLPHIIDWLITDPRGIEAVRTAPEATFLDSLYANADTFFKAQGGGYRDTAPIADEPGREVVITFRSLEGAPPQMFQDKTLTPNEHGRVVMFWCKLISTEALEREGKLMGHCVGNGSYAQSVASSRTTIYSLRDAENQPGVTVEVNADGNGFILNQVKGKGNKAPVAKYAPFVKGFLNLLDVRVTHHGEGDVRGLGLFAHNGKFGSIEEVGAPISATFPNGDSFRADVSNAAPGVRDARQELFYVEKGAIPFKIYLSGKTDESGKIANAKLSGLRILRDEPSRYPVWVANLTSYLNDHGIPPDTRELERFGIFYNAENKQYGSIDDVSTKLYDHGDIAARGMEITEIKRNNWDKERRSYETVFTVGDTPLFVLHSNKTPGRANWVPSSIKIPSKSAGAASKIPAILIDFLNHVKASYPDRDDEREILRNYGAIYNRDRWLRPDEGKKVFETKRGSITMNGAFVYVLDKSGDLLASARTSNRELSGHKLETFADDKYEQVLNILSEWSNSVPDPAMQFSGFNDRKDLEAGYCERGSKLIPTSTLYKKIVIAGERVEITVKERGFIDYSLTKGGSTLTVQINEDNIVQHITNEGNALRKFAPALLKAIGAKVSIPRLLSFGLKLQNGKPAAIDHEKDHDLLQFIKGTMDLPGGFEWDRYDRNNNSYSNSGYGRALSPAGNIRIKDGYSHVATIEIDKYGDDERDYYNDPAYKMRRNLPDGVSREDVMKTVVAFMRFYHNKVEQYEVDRKKYVQF